MTRQPFHRSDFTGSAGPGLKKLRSAQLTADELARGIAAFGKVGLSVDDFRNAGKKLGLESVLAFMRAGRWEDAILAAAKFSDLGDQAEAIQRGREAIQRPAFQRQLKRDPEALIEAAKAALLKRWPL